MVYEHFISLIAKKNVVNIDGIVGKIMPKFDSRWNSTARPPFRIIALFLSIFYISMATLALMATFSSCTIEFDTRFKLGVLGLFWGIIFLIIAIRGRIIKRDIEK